MKKNKYYIFLIIIGAVFFLFIYFLTNNYQSEKDESYKRITYTDKIAGMLEKIDDNRGVLYIDLSKGIKFSIGASTRNYNYNRNDIWGFLNKGDSIVKPANTDTIYVIRKGIVYFFVIDSVIDKPLR